MFKLLIPAIFLMANAFGEFNISNIKLTSTEVVIEGDRLEDITSLALISGKERVDFQVDNALSNKVIAYPQDNGVVSEDNVLKLVISNSTEEFTYPIALAEKNDSYTSYKLQKKKESISIPEQKFQDKLVLENKSKINFLPGDDFNGYDYNYSIYANPNGDLAIKGIDKDLFKIDNEGNVEISGTLKVKGKPIGYGFVPLNDSSVPVNVVTKSTNFTAANKVVLSAGPSKELSESGYTIPMNICPKGQILKSDGVNFVCALESSQEEQLGPVYTNNKSNFGINQINRNLQISNVVIGADNNISGVVNFTASGDVTIATSTFKVTGGNVGIGTASPSVKLDVIGGANSGIRLKQGGQATNTSGSFSNGIVFEDSASTKAVGIGYGVGDLFSIIGNNGSAYNTLFTLNGSGNGVITGNLKIGAYTLPAADGASGTVLKTDGAGLVSWSPVSGGTVNGPGTTVVGNIASWNNITGTLLADGGKPVSQLVTNAGTSTNGFVAVFNGTSGQSIQNGTKLETDLVTGPASASATDNLASFNGLTGKIIKDSGILSTNVMTMSAPALSGNILTSTGGKGAADSLVNISNVPTMAAAAGTTNALLLSAGTDKTVKTTGFNIPFGICPNGQSWKSDGANMICSGSTTGDVTGPGTSNLNAIPRFSDTTGKVIKNSGVTISDTNDVTGIATLSTSGLSTLNSLSVTTNASITGTLSTGGAATLNSLAVTNAATVGGTLGVAGVFTANNGTGNQFSLPQSKGTVSQVLTSDGAGGTNWSANPQGDVVGQGTSAIDNIPVYADTAGKLIKDSTLPVSQVIRKVSNFTSANRLAISSGTNHTIIESGYIFPTADGTANQILKTNGTGTVAWSDAPATFGDVVGPGTSTAGAPAIFANATGKLLAGTVPYTIPTVNGTNGQVLTTNGSGAASWANTGNVTGAASSISGNLASFSDGTGKSIADSGIVSANVVSNLGTSGDMAIAKFSGTGGKTIQNSGVTINGTNDMSGIKDLTITGTLSSGAITSTGTLNVTGGGSFSGPLTAQSYANNSDRNLKKDIVLFTGASDIVDQLVPVKFRWKKGDGKLVMGLIAQDVEKIIPEVVTITKTKDGEIRSYDVGQVLALTLEALKETREEVKRLQEKVRKLEQKNP